jgi:hypothetical protein
MRAFPFRQDSREHARRENDRHHHHGGASVRGEPVALRRRIRIIPDESNRRGDDEDDRERHDLGEKSGDRDDGQGGIEEPQWESERRVSQVGLRSDPGLPPAGPQSSCARAGRYAREEENRNHARGHRDENPVRTARTC